jgi:hypothetical protein
MSIQSATHPASYRDPAGFIFIRDGIVYRQINQVFQADFEHFIQSGCYKHLVDKDLLISHENVDEQVFADQTWFKTIRPEQLPFISYPSEWPFDMLKDAALLTLQLAKEAIGFKMILKDATPYNIQWHNGKLKFIDSLSFERYDESQPWIAYRQFCESFLAPLLLMHYNRLPTTKTFLAYPDGIPLDLTQRMLPWKSRFSFHTYLHIHLQNKVSRNASQQAQPMGKFSMQKLLNVLSSLETLVLKLQVPRDQTTWSEYYEEASLRDDYLATKQELVKEWIDIVPARTCIDFGANEGAFSQIAATKNIETIAADFDPICVNRLYQKSKAKPGTKILPLVLDISNPTPGTGLNNQEHQPFLSRASADLSLALALVHHLAIGKNIPLDKVAAFFAGVSKHLLIEFVPKSDEKIRLMLQSKKDIYSNYNQENFESAFGDYFRVEKHQMISSSGRILYLMIRKD